MYKQTSIISDFEECIANDSIKIIKLTSDLSNPKRPLKDIYEYITLEELEYFDGNIGISFPKKEDIKQGEPFLIAIDIDGETQGVDNELKPILKEQSRLLLYNILKDGLEKRGYSGMYVKTPTNGFHIYLWATQATFQQHGFNNFLFPDGVAFTTDFYKNLSSQHDLSLIPTLYKQRMSNKSVEIFSQATMIVAPGSTINGRRYEVLSSGAQSFKEISIIRDIQVEDLIFEILEDHLFVRKSISTDSLYISQPETNIHDLTPENIKNIGNLIIEYWPEIDGEKQEASLALGGFLNAQGVSQKSIIDIGEYVLENKNYGMFKGSDDYERNSGFIPSLLHDSNQPSAQKRTGLTSLSEKFFEKKDVSRFKKVLWLNTALHHTFYPNGQDAEKYPKVVLDFDTNTTRFYSIKTKKDSDGNPYPSNEISTKIGNIPLSISYINDLSGKPQLYNEDKPIKLKILTKNDIQYDYIFTNTNELLRNYNSLPHCHVENGSKIGSFIFREYEDLLLIDTIDSSSRPGIFPNTSQNGLRKFVQTKQGLEEIQPYLVNREELIDALNLLEEIRDVYPWHEDKFASIIKLGLLLPYGYCYKILNGNYIPGIILSGEAGTLKSSVGELITALSLDMDEILNESHYIMGGSEVKSEYRFGRAFDRGSYPIVINECEDTFSNRDNIELVKNAISGDLIREPSGRDPRAYYAVAVPVLTINNKPDAMEVSDFARRFLSIEFVGSERGDTREMIKKLEFLNVDGKMNYRFRELRIIGDFVYFILNKHIDYFHYQPQDIADNIIQEIMEYTGKDLSWLLNVQLRNAELDRREEENNNEFLMCSNLIYDYIADMIGANNKHLINQRIMSEVNIRHGLRKGDAFVTLIDSDTGVLILANGFKKEFRKKYYDYNKKMNLSQFTDILNQLNVFEEKKQNRSQRKVNNKNVKGLFLTWDELLHLLNIEEGIQDDSGEDEVS